MSTPSKPAIQAFIEAMRETCDVADELAQWDPIIAQCMVDQVSARVARFEREVPLEVKREVLG